jgi:PAS domain S-box-containing protein
LRAVIDGTTDAVYVKDRQGRYLMMNAAGAEFLGKTVAEVIGQDDTRQFSPQTARAIMEADGRVMATGEVQTYEDVGTAAGVTRTYLSTKGPYRDADGAVCGVIGISRDITERKRAEEARARLAAIVELSEDAILSESLDGVVLSWNRAAEKMFGYPAAEMLGRPLAPLVPEDRAAEASAILTQVGQGRRVENHETVRLRKDGARVDVALSVSPLLDASGRVTGVAKIARDITARKGNERRLAAEHAVTRVLAESASLDEAAPEVLRAVGETLGYDLGVLWEVSLDPDGLRCVAVWRPPGAPVAEFERHSPRIAVARGEGLPGRAWDTGRPAWVPDAPFPLSAAAARVGPCGALAAPLVSDGTVLGVIEFFSPELRHLPECVQAMVSSVATQVGQFIERRRAERMLHAREREFRLAREIQQGLLPRTLPAVPGLQIAGVSHPAQETGGDSFDFIPLADGALGVSIGAATGPGIGAALLIAETRAYLRALTLTHTDPGTILRLLNSRLAEEIGTGHFVTLLLARLSPPPCTLDYSNAGHWPGHVIDARGEVKSVLPSMNLPLGVDPGGDFPTGRPVALDPGDVIVLLSDGIIEAPSGAGQLFGMDRAIEAVRAHRQESPGEIIDALLTQVREWSRTTQEDDMTVVVIKVVG